ncbi:hypothetical protein OJO68_23340 [Escherichia coli]|nr:hypothetical protein [Escherichia coli]MCW3190386.1 hypothetical protein [Escherichia coli]
MLANLETSRAARAASKFPTTNPTWLKVHEQLGGHTIARHVGKTDKELINRLASNRRISGASTYTNGSIAERVISQTINENRSKVVTWLKNANAGERLRLDHIGATGEVISRGISKGQSTVSDLTNARVILQSTGNGKYHILTSFPG